jgi:cell division protein FtsI/penicillin-binding protein 2
MVSAIANGGTLYYLQYPKNPEDLAVFQPQVKRYLDIQTAIPEMKPGMLGAVDFGTARRALYDMNEPIFGKTGTCTDARTHLGWFGSFNEIGDRKLVVVVLLTGGKHVNGPVASGVAGQVYKLLSQQQYFAGLEAARPLESAPAEFSNSEDNLR